MKVYKRGFTTATLQPIGTMFLVTTGNNKKMFDNQITAINYINNIL